MWTERLINACLGMTAAVAVVWLVALLAARASAALRHSLWRLALGAFWVLPVLLMVTSGMSWQHLDVPLPVPAALPEAFSAALPRPGPVASAAGSPGAPIVASTPVRRSLPVGEGLLLLWLFGGVASLLILVRDGFAARRLRRDCVGLEDPDLRERVARWAARLDLRRAVRLARCALVPVPTVAGLRRPALLIPEGFALDGPGFDAVAVHELAHVRRGDLAAQVLARLTCALWWWHPLAWLTARELRQSAEEACDDWAVALTNQPHPYADLLVHWATTARPHGNLACLHPGKALVRRVRRVLSGVARPARLGAGARVALVACAVVALIGVTAVRVRVLMPPAVAQGGGPAESLPADVAKQFDTNVPMVEVPAGDFLFGEDNKRVRLYKFWIDKYEVTDEEYSRYVRATGAEQPFLFSSGRGGAGRFPVTYVSRDDALGYARWVGKDLPTEEEWEKAARGTDGRKYPWGDVWDNSKFSYYSHGVLVLGPVGAFLQGASPYGAEDMLGNAFEWTKTDTVMNNSARAYAVVRGGDISNDFRKLTVTHRNMFGDGRFLYVGFRCVKRLQPGADPDHP